jgi:hypothetical protein
MSARTFRLLAGLCGVLGPVTLVTSFLINPAPPADATAEQLAAFGVAHHNTIVLGGWLQGMGSLLIVIFALALVHLAGATHRFAGWLTLLSGSAILAVSLVEITFYLADAQAAESRDVPSGLASENLRKAVQHVFLIAPALCLPLGVVLLRGGVLPRVFAYSSLALGGTLQVLGLVGLFNVLQPVIDVLLIGMSLWFVAAAVALIARADRAPDKVPEKAVA